MILSNISVLHGFVNYEMKLFLFITTFYHRLYLYEYFLKSTVFSIN